MQRIGHPGPSRSKELLLESVKRGKGGQRVATAVGRAFADLMDLINQK